jgi:hypothetical protein
MSLAALPEGLARADGMTGVIIFAVVYAIVSIMAKAKQAAQRGARDGSGTPGGASPANQQGRPPERQLQRPKPSAGRARPAGSTQSEGARLEDLLRVLTEAAGVPTTTGRPPEDRPAPGGWPGAEEVEERESLEVVARVESRDPEIHRAARREVDYDDEAEAVVVRRIRAAEVRDRALNREDHQAFDRRIRAEVPDATRVARPRLTALRQAIVWREILGPPVALRPPSEVDF